MTVLAQMQHGHILVKSIHCSASMSEGVVVLIHLLELYFASPSQ